MTVGGRKPRKTFRQNSDMPEMRSILAWMIACSVGTSIAGVLDAILGSLSSPDTLEIVDLVSGFVLGAFSGALIGPIPSLIVGYFLERYFRNRGWTHPLAYVAFGGLVATFACGLLVTLFSIDLSGAMLHNIGLMAGTIPIFSFCGLISGGVFWLIRRPDRDILVEETRDKPAP